MVFKSRECFDPLPYNDTMVRFDSRYWSIDYPLTAIATIVDNGIDELTVYSEHRSNKDLVGLIWSSRDKYGHESFQYAFDTDYTGTKLVFQANFSQPFDATVTINGTWVVRVYPYEIVEQDLIPVDHPSKYPPDNILPWYPKSLINGKSPKTDEGMYWYVIDFDNLYTGFDMKTDKVSSVGITDLFISITSIRYGMGINAKLRNEYGTTDWFVFQDVIDDLVLSKGDIIEGTILAWEATSAGKDPDWKLVSHPFGCRVEVWEKLDKNQVRVKADQTYYNMNFFGEPVAFTGAPKADTPVGNQVVNLTIANMCVHGRNTIPKRNYPDPAHSLYMTSGFDDTYNITPYRQIQQAYDLGYRGWWNTYMGMSHYFKTEGVFVNGKFKAQLVKDLDFPLNTPTVMHLRSLFSKMKEMGYTFIWSTAYEILNSVMPEEWKQRNASGAPALTGWVPPSSFIQPSRDECLDYLAAVIKHGMLLLTEAGHVEKRFQIGEPWWWDGLYSDGQPCIYDQYTMDLYKSETGLEVPEPKINYSIVDINDPQYVASRPYVQWLQDKLGRSTNYIKNAVKAVYPEALSTLLFFTPQIMNPSSTFLTLLNFPEERWKYPEYDFMQIEDYDWLIDGKLDLNPLTFQAATDRLQYPANVVEYFVGFVNTKEQRWVWPNMQIAIKNARNAGIQRVGVWAYPQIIRDSILWYDIDEVAPPPDFPLPPRQLVGTHSTYIEPRILVAIGDTLRLQSGIGNFEFRGEIYFGIGSLGSIGNLNENITMAHGGYDLKLESIPAYLYDQMIHNWRGDYVEIYLSVSQDITPVQIFKGKVSSHDVAPNAGGSLTVTMRVKNILAELDKNVSSRYTNNNQLKQFPGDVGLEFVAGLQNIKIEWGYK